MSKEEFTLNITFVPYDGEVTYGNYTRLSRVGLDVFVDIGVYDVHEVATTIGKAKAKAKAQREEIEKLPLKMKIVQRIAMSPSTFEKFREQVEIIYEAYKKEGTLGKKK